MGSEKRNLVLVTVSGKDSPGITSEITKVLAESGVTILDIGQAVIRELLSLSILFELNGKNSEEAQKNEKAAIKDLLFVASEMGLSLNFQMIKEPHKSQVAQDSLRPSRSMRQRYAVTLIGSSISATALFKVSNLLASYKFNIDRIDRMSDENFGCVELQVSRLQLTGNDPTALPMKELRKRLLTIGKKENIDIAFQVEGPFRKVKRLIVFDMDSTLIQCEVVDEFARELGKYDAVAAITHQSMNGQMDFDESLRLRCAQLEGLTRKQIEEVLERIQLTPGATDLIQMLKKLGYKIGIISGGFSCIAERLREKLGIDYAYANHLEFVNGVCTGRVQGPIINAQRKADLLETLAQQERIVLDQVVAIGDGANDLLMLEKAGLGVAFNAKPLVLEKARHSINQKNLKSILYLLGLSEEDLLKLL